ncbi:glycosyltransferase [Bradyrhizobium prioriisuperbiae]|uniref:glycosyltransferase n=1 Tax=Bradyrhizobium prioriisuperbiae TaxID=2854389 RepID=UPI0028E89CB7|nr:glycosyltransferase [Bradyrhizobium prioritasuperba]
MNVLFVHNNFPAQFQQLARFLSQQPGVTVAAVGAQNSRAQKGVRLVKYSLTDVDVSASHPFARRFDLECHRAEQVLYALTTLASSGFVPEVIVAHPGWGETLPLRAVFPKARLIVYCEFFYGTNDRDIGFDSEFPAIGVDGHVALQMKNAATLLALSECDAGLAPTQWQRSTFPRLHQDRISVLHEGIDTAAIKPSQNASFRLPSGRVLSAKNEVVTFVARNLEPLRGYHVFMRALPRLMAERPNAEILIIGGHGTSYGAPPPAGKTWQSIYLEEVSARIDMRRVHLAGHLPYQDYLRALQISSAHVYLTYPFVLSWSLLEAMSAGCLVIGSDTAPVREIINAENGILVPFFDTDQLSKRLIEALAHRERFNGIRTAARQTILDQYDLARTCLPALVAFVRGGETPSELPRFLARAG